MNQTTVDHGRDSRTGSHRVRVALDLSAGLVLCGVATVATWWVVDVPTSVVWTALGLYAGLALLVLAFAPPSLPRPGIGSANRVTLGRACLAVPVAALAFQAGPLSDLAHWWIVVLSTVVLVLDGVDGRVARATDTRTGFGARFDMELDAALILALSVIVWTSGRAGSWVLLIGLMRYGFVAAGWVWPILKAELPESFRRKTACVVQGVVLLVALGPVIPDELAVVAVAVGLAVLVYSFAVDVAWLVRNGRTAGAEPAS